MEEVAGTGWVRVVALNLWGRHGYWEERRPVLAEGLREIRTWQIGLFCRLLAYDFLAVC